MTQAVCFKCGGMKHEPFTDCPRCGGRSVTDDKLLPSLATTNHYLDLATMKKMETSVAEGKPLHLDEKSRQGLLKQLENVQKTPLGRLLGGGGLSPKKKKSK